ncbi:winged helix DNA-binding protein [Aurantiacibacter poecillastricola]|uniref:winged helix DNA-binding protein n=1 Tax=Aurantiacibacter poecillastricola TaxID=3064385 RepID=UPI00273FEC17|nr:winged helix DNA-binding protein [Aurantiacibacter sp. 219JJ12-13]MDP5261458.1 winged helix DNA-binding protein [Aurantiacibacter sp. 219JJ12-13]
MTQVDFAYEMAADAAGLPLAVSIFADGEDVREELRADVQAAGLATRESGSLEGLLNGEPRALGDLVLVDCPQPDMSSMAALARLDSRVAHSGARLIVSTSRDGLEDVFGTCAEGAPHILVDARRADRILALGRMLAECSTMRLRELSEDDRLTLLRLTEQVGQIAQRLDSMGGDAGERGQRSAAAAFSFDKLLDETVAGETAPKRKARPPLPDAALVRQIIRQRRIRARFFDENLFADPAWDMLLDLTAARVEHARVSVTSLCLASGVPPTTALRWIGQMTEAGLFERVEDDTDRRRAFVRLSDAAADGMARYFAELGQDAKVLA